MAVESVELYEIVRPNRLAATYRDFTGRGVHVAVYVHPEVVLSGLAGRRHRSSASAVRRFGLNSRNIGTIEDPSAHAHIERRRQGPVDRTCPRDVDISVWHGERVRIERDLAIPVSERAIDLHRSRWRCNIRLRGVTDDRDIREASGNARNGDRRGDEIPDSRGNADRDVDDPRLTGTE